VQNRILIAGTGSGVGKTTLTIGIMAALKERCCTVQGFKCGPDYIDPTYHTAVTGRQSRNLDSWMLSRRTAKEIFRRAGSGADISIIEGAMGLFDGKHHLSNEGSAADIAILLDCPVLLVVNCSSMGRSAAAVVKGFQQFSKDVRIAGIIANKVGSEGHYQLVKEAVEQECGLPAFGYLLRDAELEIPERHLGLVPSVERGELKPFFEKLGRQVASTIDVEAIRQAAACPDSLELELDERTSIFEPPAPRYDVCIAVARDAAFNFYYPENLELLQAYGARLRFFSPLAGEPVPDEADGLYIGGGFPEEFAGVLAEGEAVKASVRSFIERGKPTFAECGGFMYLTEAIVDTEGRRYAMAGVIPGHVTMQKKLASFGYREIWGASGNFLLREAAAAKGHEFHYSVYQSGSSLPAAYLTAGRTSGKEEGVLYRKLVAGYTHIHFASDPELAQRFVSECRGV
jgi:cobyrinic acid a,c-diamide synthase